MPQNMLTEPESEQDVGELAPLSPEETRFVEALAVRSSNVDAYREAYGAEGYSAAALRVQACRKAGEPKIRAHLKLLRANGLANARLTLNDRIEEELAFAQRCEDSGNMGAAGQARDRVNKLLGLYVEKVADVTEHDPARTLAEIAQHSPEYAAELAKQHNIPMPDTGQGVTTRH
jgi:hypothetical protein